MYVYYVCDTTYQVQSLAGRMYFQWESLGHLGWDSAGKSFTEEHKIYMKWHKMHCAVSLQVTVTCSELSS